MFVSIPSKCTHDFTDQAPPLYFVRVLSHCTLARGRTWGRGSSSSTIKMNYPLVEGRTLVLLTGDAVHTSG